MRLDESSTRRKRKAIAGILAGVIFFAMLFTAGMGLILFTFTSYNNYDKAQVAAVQTQQAKNGESASLRSCSSSPPNPNYPLGNLGTCPAGDVGVYVQNTGSGGMTLTAVYVLDSTTNQRVYDPTTLQPPPIGPVTINPGKNTVVDVTAATGFLVDPLSTDKYAIGLVTQMGNVFLATYPPPPGIVVTTQLTERSIQGGLAVFDTASLIGATSNAGGTITYETYQTGVCSGTATPVLTNPPGANPPAGDVVNGVPPPSQTIVYVTVGPYSWNAIYSGDPNNAGAKSACEPLNVPQTIPSISTTLASAIINGGGSTADYAQLSGVTPNAGGYISFYYGTTCPGGMTPVPDPVIPTNPQHIPVNGPTPVNGPPYGPSNTVTFQNPGTYYWNAVYSGDSNNGGATSQCEAMLVLSPAGKALTPSISTSLSQGTILAGQSVSDTATLTVSSGNPVPTGTVLFVAYSDSACTTPYASAATTLSSTVPPYQAVSPAVAFSGSGNYHWVAAYSGDANYNPMVSPCSGSGSEPLTVSKASPTITTVLSGGGYTFAGGAEADTATLSSSSGTNAGGTVTYNYFDNANHNDATCSGTPIQVGTSPVTVTNGNVPNSAAQTFGAAGTYSWDAVYSGDPNNNGPVTSSCEVLTVVSPVAGTTFGIGFIGFDFNSFNYYTLSGSGCPPSFGNYPTGCTLSAPTNAFTITGAAGEYIVFGMNIKNVDPANRPLVLDQNTYLQALLICDQVNGCGNPGGTSNVWQLGCVQSNEVVSFSSCGAGGITIAPQQTTTVYFVTSLDNTPPAIQAFGSKFIPITSIFILFHGTIGGSPYAQNLPYTSILWN